MDLKREPKNEVIEETLADDSLFRDDGEDFILPSQPTERSVEAVNDTTSILSQEAYMLPTLCRTMLPTTINETVQNIDASLNDKEDNDMLVDDSAILAPKPLEFNKLPHSEDLFNTEANEDAADTQGYDLDESLVQATPLFGGRVTVPETPAKTNGDTDDESYLETPHLSRIRQGTQLASVPIPPATFSQLADTQPAQDASIITIESDTSVQNIAGEGIDMGSPGVYKVDDILRDEFQIPPISLSENIVHQSNIDVSIEEIGAETSTPSDIDTIQAVKSPASKNSGVKNESCKISELASEWAYSSDENGQIEETTNQIEEVQESIAMLTDDKILDEDEIHEISNGQCDGHDASIVGISKDVNSKSKENLSVVKPNETVINATGDKLPLVNDVASAPVAGDIKEATDHGDEVHVNTQPVKENGDGDKNLSPSHQRTLSAENYQSASDTTTEIDTDAEKSTEAVPTPVRDDNSFAEVPPPATEATTTRLSFAIDVVCEVEYDKLSGAILHKKIVSARERMIGVLDSCPESSDKSKRESMSSAGSVYSDKTGLPYPLKPRMSLASVQTSSTSTVDDNQVTLTPTLGDLKPWINDALVPLACDDALARWLAQRLPPAIRKTPSSRLSLASKALFEKVKNSSFDISSREQSMEEVVAISHHALEASIAAKDTDSLESVEKAEEADIVAPLPKSTPKRTRRPTRGKGKARGNGRKKNAVVPLSSGRETNDNAPVEIPKSSEQVPEENLPNGSIDSVIRPAIAQNVEKIVSDGAKKSNAVNEPPVKKSGKKRTASLESVDLPGTDAEAVGTVDKAVSEESVSTRKKSKGLMEVSGEKSTTHQPQTEKPTKKTIKKEIQKANLSKTPATPRSGRGKISTKSTPLSVEPVAGPSGVKRVIKATPQKQNTINSDSSFLSSSSAECDVSSSTSVRKRGRAGAAIANSTPKSTRTTPMRSSTSASINTLGFAPDVPVFARWVDNFYYPGRLEKDMGSKWTVAFADGNNKPVATHFILLSSSLREGHCVMVDNNDDYGLGFLTAIRSNGDYEVEVNDVRKVVKATHLRLTCQQVKTVCEDQPATIGTPTTSKAAVDPDNIVPDRRRAILTDSSSELSGSGIGSSKKRRRLNTPEVMTGLEFTPGLEMDETVVNKITANTKAVPGKSTPKSRKNASKSVTDPMDAKLGPIPPPGSSIFTNLCFLLCYVKPKTRRSAKSLKAVSDSDVSMSESEDMSSYDKYEKFPFDASRLRDQLLAGGGTVYDRFEDVPSSKYKDTKLITNRPNRSAKFLLCLVHNIDIVLHLHVIEACRGKEFKSVKLHHAGWSEAANRWMDRPAKIQKTFSGKQIHVYTKSQDAEADALFIAFWHLILKKAGGNVVEDANYADIIVADASLPREMSESVEALGDTGPLLVSTHWVIESLMHGVPLEQHLHLPVFKYNYESASSC